MPPLANQAPLVEKPRGMRPGKALIRRSSVMFHNSMQPRSRLVAVPGMPGSSQATAHVPSRGETANSTSERGGEPWSRGTRRCSAPEAVCQGTLLGGDDRPAHPQHQQQSRTEAAKPAKAGLRRHQRQSFCVRLIGRDKIGSSHQGYRRRAAPPSHSVSRGSVFVTLGIRNQRERLQTFPDPS
jgi:hypothetical protein